MFYTDSLHLICIKIVPEMDVTLYLRRMFKSCLSYLVHLTLHPLCKILVARNRYNHVLNVDVYVLTGCCIHQSRQRCVRVYARPRSGRRGYRM